LIVTPHGAVVAILPAVVGYFDHAAHKHLPPKDGIPRRRRPRMKHFLRFDDAVHPQKVLPHPTHGLLQDSGLPPKHNPDFHVHGWL
jgi:hypothetical protein